MSNVQTPPLQNALAGGANGMSPQLLHNSLMQGNISAGVFRRVPRAHIEVDKVSNGFVFKCGDDLLIAKDLEELQQHFVAAIAAMLLEDK